MAIFKCKMCGGALDIKNGETVCQCEYCGTKQTVPKLDDEKKANLYDRANHFRRNNDYDKAMNTYEKILNEDGTDAEAYWSLVLCRYGIEYVEDSATHKRVPTINRTQYTSIYADENYKSAIEYADSSQKIVYENEAKAIDDIQKGILEISSKESPFDVFICYKETDQNGRRTQDSVLANDLYHQLTQEGFKVFFSRITLEDKLGTAYEPYIFAALNSSKVMVVLGTKPEYFNAVWVKNEWSRYLALISNGQKKMLIPAYRDMDPYDLPEEFSHLQAQDMSKLGFMQDLIRGIKKIIGTEKVNEKPIIVENNVASSTIGNVNALIKRGNMALEDGEWHRADEFFEEVLNQDAECSQAYLGKWMAKLNVSKTEQIIKHYVNKYDNPQAKVVEACPEQTEHINQMATEYYIDKYLSKTEIEHMYAFDRTFESHLDSRIELEKQAIEEIDSERLYHRALQYAVGEEKNTVKSIVEDIRETLERYIENEKEHDNEIIEQIENRYRKKIIEIDTEVKNRYEKQMTEIKIEYEQSIIQFNKAKRKSEYEKCRSRFEKYENYLNASEYISECNKYIQRNKKFAFILLGTIGVFFLSTIFSLIIIYQIKLPVEHELNKNEKVVNYTFTDRNGDESYVVFWLHEYQQQPKYIDKKIKEILDIEYGKQMYYIVCCTKIISGITLVFAVGECIMYYISRKNKNKEKGKAKY